jgi:aldoxime dehydratase
MEPSIAEHLVQPRTRPARKGENFQPAYPSFSARFDPTVTRVVMAYYGVQFTGPMPPVASGAIAELHESAGLADGPAYRDQARYQDEAGYETVVNILYWTDIDAHDRWSATAADWTAPERYRPEAGFFTEIVTPTVDRFETLFSNDRVEGISTAAGGLSGEIREHAYWGGTRDRLPLAQVDPLEPHGQLTVSADAPLVRVSGQDNLCLIRSGQEWTETADDERALYLDDVEPVLQAGMDFLRDDGLSIGCVANRYLQIIDDDGNAQEKTFGMSWWRSLQDLETWSEAHPTHLAIFRTAMKYLSTMGPAAKVRLYHEVTVVQAAQQQFTYLGCHANTGLLRAAQSPAG